MNREGFWSMVRFTFAYFGFTSTVWLVNMFRKARYKCHPTKGTFFLGWFWNVAVQNWYLTRLSLWPTNTNAIEVSARIPFGREIHERFILATFLQELFHSRTRQLRWHCWSDGTVLGQTENDIRMRGSEFHRNVIGRESDRNDIKWNRHQRNGVPQWSSTRSTFIWSPLSSFCAI